MYLKRIDPLKFKFNLILKWAFKIGHASYLSVFTRPFTSTTTLVMLIE